MDALLSRCLFALIPGSHHVIKDWTWGGCAGHARQGALAGHPHASVPPLPSGARARTRS